MWGILEDLATEDLGLPPRVADGLYDASFGRDVTNRYYRSLADVSVATATNDLAKLDASGLLNAQGAGHSRLYTGSEALMAAVTREADLGDVPTASPIEVQRQWVMTRLATRVHGA